MEPFQKALKHGAERICNLILFSDYEWIDIQIEAEKLRDYCEEHRPEKLFLFDAIYYKRFERLWEQWRSCEQETESFLPPTYFSQDWEGPAWGEGL